MKILQTSGTLNERIGQYINTALKEESDRERERERKPEEMGGNGGRGEKAGWRRGRAGVRESGNSIITVPWQ